VVGGNLPSRIFLVFNNPGMVAGKEFGLAKRPGIPRPVKQNTTQNKDYNMFVMQVQLSQFKIRPRTEIKSVPGLVLLKLFVRVSE
jgi:hypothetical protein